MVQSLKRGTLEVVEMVIKSFLISQSPDEDQVRVRDIAAFLYRVGHGGDFNHVSSPTDMEEEYVRASVFLPSALRTKIETLFPMHRKIAGRISKIKTDTAEWIKLSPHTSSERMAQRDRQMERVYNSREVERYRMLVAEVTQELHEYLGATYPDQLRLYPNDRLARHRDREAAARAQEARTERKSGCLFSVLLIPMMFVLLMVYGFFHRWF